MNTHDANKPLSLPALADSIQAGHRFAGAIERSLENMLGVLEGIGHEGMTKGDQLSSGILGDSASLADRLNRIIDLADRIGMRLRTPETPEADIPMGLSTGRDYR